MATGKCYPKYQILYVFKIKVVFTPSSYNVSASCIIIYNQTVCPFQYIQIDSAMAYQCMYQDEVSVALWSRESISLFACELTTIRPTTTMVICTDYKSNDKFSNGIFLEYLYDNIIPKNDEFIEEIIWSDGVTSEFKNKYMCHLLDKCSTKYNKRFLWKFSATSHGKEVVDGIGGNVKSIVHSQSMGKRNDQNIVQDAKSFCQVARKAMNATEVFLIDKTQVEAQRDTDPFNGCQTVPGIMSMHIISVGDDGFL